MKPAALCICTTRLLTTSCWGGALVYTPPGHTRLLGDTHPWKYKAANRAIPGFAWYNSPGMEKVP